MRGHSGRMLAAGLILLAAAGCNTLPEGEPPPGNITSNPPDSDIARTLPEAREYFTAMVSLESAALCPGAVLTLRADAATAPAAAAILRESGATSGIRRAAAGEPADGELRSRIQDGCWIMEIYRQDKLLWRDRVRLLPSIK